MQQKFKAKKIEGGHFDIPPKASRVKQKDDSPVDIKVIF